jgi:thiosulfate dehydrogenase [quinone] large subunit
VTRAHASLQALALLLLRTIVGWHFAYEGYYKLVLPGWSRDGAPLGSWSASGYLLGATGPFAGLFRDLGASGAGPWVDAVVPIGLLVTGLLLMLGLFTQLGAWLALGQLSLFYLAAIPVHGVPVHGAEGAYLLVNKTLVEWAAVAVLIAFRTGRIAGLDVLWTRARDGSRDSSVAPPGAAASVS